MNLKREVVECNYRQKNIKKEIVVGILHYEI